MQYAGILDETKRVREAGGLFDLCHMGRIEVRGPQREALVEHVFSASLAKLKFGRAKYGFLLDPQGYPIDDVLVYRDRTVVHIVINATGRTIDAEAIESQRPRGMADATLEEVSSAQAMIALQGRISERVLQKVCKANLADLRYYAFVQTEVLGTPTLVARTGYTGEDGFELFFDPARAVAIWDALLDAGREEGIAPIGLGARDLLRLEAGMPLYGQEIDRTIDPLEAGLAFGLDATKHDTVGISPLFDRHAHGTHRHAVSVAATGGPVPRTGMRVSTPEGKPWGVVTSGGASPTVGKNIARVLLTGTRANPGETVHVEIRGRTWPFEVVPAPFFRRSY